MAVLTRTRLTKEDIEKYRNMHPDDIPPITKKRIVEAIVGYPVSPIFCDCHDPFAVAQDVIRRSALPAHDGPRDKNLLAETREYMRRKTAR